MRAQPRRTKAWWMARRRKPLNDASVCSTTRRCRPSLSLLSARRIAMRSVILRFWHSARLAVMTCHAIWIGSGRWLRRRNALVRSSVYQSCCKTRAHSVSITKSLPCLNFRCDCQCEFSERASSPSKDKARASYSINHPITRDRTLTPASSRSAMISE